MSPALLFVALSLAAFRVWRLIGRDSITEPVRDWIGDRFKPTSKLLELLTCSWCLGTWIALLATFAVHHWLVTLEPHWLLWAVAVAGVVGLLGLIDEKLSE